MSNVAVYAYEQLILLHDTQLASFRDEVIMHPPRVRYGDWLRAVMRSCNAPFAECVSVCAGLVDSGMVRVDFGKYVSLEVNGNGCY